MVKDPAVGHGGGSGAVAGSSVSASLLVRLKARDPAAWSALVSLYGREVARWCRQAGLRDHDAEDVTQEVFRAVSSSLAEFRRDRPGDSFRGWLWTIARNKIRDHRRRTADQPEAIGGTDAQARIGRVPAPEDDPSGPDGCGTSSGLARRALDLIRSSFEERTWKAFWGVVIEERPAAAVAAELGTTPNAVYIARSRVLGRLRAEFGELLS
jgi:RNA polymerase sigma-70 factor (ECF subfamily)